MFKKYLLLTIIVTIATISCVNNGNEEPDFIVIGLKPIYGVADSLKKIEISDPREIQNAGRIVYLAPYLFVNEIDEGIHLIDNSDPENPQKQAFISIPYNRDIAIKGNYIYADNMNDLISLKFVDSDSIKLIARQKNAFDHLPAFPSDYTGYFECIDESKGDIVGWISTKLTNPNCKNF